jgi:hypothetical protein
VTTLVRTDRPHDQDLESLRARASDLEAAHHERRAEVTAVEAELASFKIRYRSEVGLLHEELDRLELELAEPSWAGEQAGVPDTTTAVDVERIDAYHDHYDAVRKLHSATWPRPFIPISPAMISPATIVIADDRANRACAWAMRNSCA